ncbi:MAG TPA: hypothetical protein VMX35_01320 [Acidobacteriota bacterium]|nr:hypothetical protein [Acidobacteriota bacterium]
MGGFKISSWNVESLDVLFDPPKSARKTGQNCMRLAAFANQIAPMNPDILCLLEGPAGEECIGRFTSKALGGRYLAVKSRSGDYGLQGDQWIWFLVKPELALRSELLPVSTWDAFAVAVGLD